MPWERKRCPQCKRRFQTKRGATYCSRGCRNKSYIRRVVRACPTCKKLVEFGSRKRRMVTIFCSRRCRALYQPQLCKSLTAGQAGYLAGLLDGEGSIVALHRADGSVKSHRLHITNTHQGVLNWCATTTGIGKVHLQTRPQRSLDPLRADAHLSYRNCFAWAIYGVKAASVLKQILPYLQIKRDKALAALEVVRP